MTLLLSYLTNTLQLLGNNESCCGLLLLLCIKLSPKKLWIWLYLDKAGDLTNTNNKKGDEEDGGENFAKQSHLYPVPLYLIIKLYAYITHHIDKCYQYFQFLYFHSKVYSLGNFVHVFFLFVFEKTSTTESTIKLLLSQ